jgi:TPR repeat protein
VPKDVERAVAIFKQSCDEGSATSCFDLATKYSKGEGIGKDVPRALDLFERSCTLGHSNGCKVASLLLDEWHELARDVERSKEFARLACEGDPRHCPTAVDYAKKTGQGMIWGLI